MAKKINVSVASKDEDLLKSSEIKIESNLVQQEIQNVLQFGIAMQQEGKENPVGGLKVNGKDLDLSGSIEDVLKQVDEVLLKKESSEVAEQPENKKEEKIQNEKIENDEKQKNDNVSQGNKSSVTDNQAGNEKKSVKEKVVGAAQNGKDKAGKKIDELKKKLEEKKDWTLAEAKRVFAEIKEEMKKQEVPKKIRSTAWLVFKRIILLPWRIFMPAAWVKVGKEILMKWKDYAKDYAEEKKGMNQES